MWGKIKAAWARFTSHLTDDAKYWYKLWSTWLAGIWGLLMYALTEDPGSIGQVLNSIPSDYRHFVPPVAFIIAGPLPILVRLWKQKPAPPAPVVPPVADSNDDGAQQ